MRSQHTALIYAIVFGGGCAALSWEILWQLQSTLAFGVSALGTSLTLAVTMGGMTLGAWWVGAWLRERGLTHPLRLYGLLELAIGATGLLMLPGFAALEVLDARLYALSPTLGPGFQGPAIALLLAPATLAMGATVPVFQLVARAHGARISTLYAANTAGAAAGVLLLSFWVMPRLGVWRTTLLVAAINFSVFGVSRLVQPLERPAGPTEPVPAGHASRPRTTALSLVACTGFVTFALEVVWFRALRTAFWSTTATFAIILSAVLVSLALGSRSVPWLRMRGLPPAAMLVAAGVAILLGTPLVERMDLYATMDGSQVSVLLRWFGLTMAVIGPGMFCLATVLPWFLEEYREPEFTGRLFGINTLASVGGSLIGAWWLLPALGFARSAWLLGLLVVGAAAFAGGARLRWAALVSGAAALLVAASFASSPGRDRLYRQGESRERIVAHVEGPDFTTSVLEAPKGARRLLIDGFSATSEDWTSHYMVWMGRLPALLHRAPKHGLVICFGTGQTANALRQEGIVSLEVVDVSPAVFELAPLFRSNERVLLDPRVRAVTMDGRAWLRRTHRSYDVVTLEPMPPNFSGVNALYSREFYEIMAERLAPSAVVAQWLPIHLLSESHAASVAATFQAAFPDSVLWLDPISLTGILLGRRHGAGDALGDRWPGLARAPVERTLSVPEIKQGLLLDAASLARFGATGRLITDDNQLLQYSQLRAGMDGTRGRSLTRANLARLAEVARRDPYLRR